MNTDTKSFAYLQDPYAMAYPETAPFWEAAEQGLLLLKFCKDCGRAHWYPRTICPFCGEEDTEWRPASGQGRIYAFSILERADPPYALAYIELDEGPVLISNLVDCDIRDLHIGERVRAVFRQSQDGRTAPFFTKA